MAAVVFHIVFTFAAPGRNLALFFLSQAESDRKTSCNEM